METQFLIDAFHRDFEMNGPSVLRMAWTKLQGWRRYRNHPDPRLRSRYRWDSSELATVYAGSLWAARRWFKRNALLSKKIKEVLREIHREFGLKSRLAAPIVGRFIRFMIRRENRRLRRGWTFEPPTFYEKNPAALQCAV